MSESDQERIVIAAKQRFSHYGYGKTTMAEIARDCDMSVGNLYRFYKNKEEIAVAGSRTCLADKAETAEQAAGQEDSAWAALNVYFIARLRHLHAFVGETPHMHELVQLISGKHKDVLQHFEDRAKTSIASILEKGVASGEFRSCDITAVAADLYYATNKYNMPMCMAAPIEQLEAELSSLLQLIFHGLKAS